MASNDQDILEDNENAQNHIATIRELWRYLWPDGRNDLKIRVIFAMLFLIMAKIIGVYVPYLFKLAIDILNGDAEEKPYHDCRCGAGGFNFRIRNSKDISASIRGN